MKRYRSLPTACYELWLGSLLLNLEKQKCRTQPLLWPLYRTISVERFFAYEFLSIIFCWDGEMTRSRLLARDVPSVIVFPFHPVERAGCSKAAKRSPFFSSISPLRRAFGRRLLEGRL